MDVTLEEMKDMSIGSVVSMGCRGCEGFEEHKKISNENWLCNNCGQVESMNTN